MRCYALRLILSLFDILENQQDQQQTDAGTTEAAAAGPSEAAGNEQQQQPPAARTTTMPSATLRQVQATLLMHISTMLRYDAALGNEWLKWISTDAGSNSNNYFLLQVGFLCAASSNALVCVFRRL